jgi:uncharacterized membrane protein YcaP (DUF421 family)
MEALQTLIGPDKSSLSWWQESDRAVIIFFAGLALIRLSGMRTFSRFSPLDTVVTVIIGSNLSRALTGNAPFLPTLAASLAFVVLHRMLAQLALHLPWLGVALKGSPKTLVVDGEPQARAMRQEAITAHDLEEALRLKGLARMDEVRSAVLERNGAISVRAAREGG